MAIKEINLPTVISGKIGTFSDFGTATFIERVLSTEVDGVGVEIFRGAYNPTYFEVKAENSDKMLRIGIEDLLSDAVKTLMKDIQDEKTDEAGQQAVASNEG